VVRHSGYLEVYFHHSVPALARGRHLRCAPALREHRAFDFPDPVPEAFAFLTHVFLPRCRASHVSASTHRGLRTNRSASYTASCDTSSSSALCPSRSCQPYSMVNWCHSSWESVVRRWWGVWSG